MTTNLTDKEIRQLDNLVAHALTRVRFWLRKMGVSAKARRALWLDLAEMEKGKDK